MTKRKVVKCKEEQRQDINWCSNHQIIHIKNHQYESCRFPNRGNKQALTHECPEGYRFSAGKLIPRKKNSHNNGSDNPLWKGDKVGYGALHQWVKHRLPKPELCPQCNKNSPYDLSNISGEYKRDLTDWQWLCRKCHMTNDGRIERLHIARHGTGIETKHHSIKANGFNYGIDEIDHTSGDAYLIPDLKPQSPPDPRTLDGHCGGCGMDVAHGVKCVCPPNSLERQQERNALEKILATLVVDAQWREGFFPEDKIQIAKSAIRSYIASHTKATAWRKDDSGIVWLMKSDLYKKLGIPYE